MERQAQVQGEQGLEARTVVGEALRRQVAGKEEEPKEDRPDWKDRLDTVAQQELVDKQEAEGRKPAGEEVAVPQKQLGEHCTCAEVVGHW